MAIDAELEARLSSGKADTQGGVAPAHAIATAETETGRLRRIQAERQNQLCRMAAIGEREAAEAEGRGAAPPTAELPARINGQRVAQPKANGNRHKRLAGDGVGERNGESVIEHIRRVLAWLRRWLRPRDDED